MKKILAAVTVAAVMVCSAFALSFEGSAGGAYGFTTERVSGESTTGSTTTRTVNDSTDNAIGGQLEGTAYFNKNLGLRVTTDFLFPVSRTTKTTTYKNGTSQGSSSNTVDMENAFCFNAFIGPVYTLNSKSKIKFTVGAGFDVQMNNYTTVIPATVIGGITITPESSIKTSYLSYGLGANADATVKLSKALSVKAGVTSGVLWGNSATVTTTVGNNVNTNKSDYDNMRFFVIPAVSVVYKF